jgi:hypothetical protein
MRNRKEPADCHWRLRSFSLHDGFEYLSNESQERQIGGHWVESLAKSPRLKMFQQGNIQCVECGIVGTNWHIERHVNDTVMPFSVNLYAELGDEEVLMTWDHKVPRSLGGSNSLSNAQCMCSRCNGNKGNLLKIRQLIEYQADKNYLEMLRVPVVVGKLKDTIKSVSVETENFKEVNNVFR